MESTIKDVLVIGGGISGVLAGYRATEKGCSVELIEASEQIGGCVRTAKNASYWLELGAHTCYNSYTNLLGYVKRAGLEDMAIAREKAPFKLMDQGEIVSIPSQLSFLSLVMNLPKVFFKRKEGLSVKEYYTALVGDRNYEKVLTAMFNAVILQPADDFPADLFLKRRKERDKDFPKSMSFKGGIQSLLQALVEKSGMSVSKGLKVEMLSKDNAGYSVKLSDGTVRRAQKLVMATPPDVSSKLLQDSFSELSEYLAEIKMHSLRSFGFILEKEDLEIEKVAGIVPRGGDFSSILTRDVIPDAQYRGLSLHAKSSRVTLDQAKQWLFKRMGISASQLLSSFEKEHHVPSLRKGHNDLVQRVDHLLPSDLAITGNYFLGLSLEDCTERSTTEVDRILA